MHPIYEWPGLTALSLAGKAVVWKRIGVPGSVVLQAPFNKARYSSLPPLYVSLLLACGSEKCFFPQDIAEQLATAPLSSAPQIVVSDTVHLADLIEKLPVFVSLIDQGQNVHQLIFGINHQIDFAQPIRRELPLCSLPEFADLGSCVTIRCGNDASPKRSNTASVVLCTKNNTARLFIIEPPPT